MLPAKLWVRTSADTVGSGGGGSSGAVNSNGVIVMPAGRDGRDVSSAASAAVGWCRASTVRDGLRASWVMCAFRASGGGSSDRAERLYLADVSVDLGTPERCGEGLRASIAAREKRFGRLRIASRMSRASSTSSSALCATCTYPGRYNFLGEARGDDVRVPIVKASAISKALGRRGAVLGAVRRVGTVARFEERAAAMLDRDRVVDMGGLLLWGNAGLSELG